MMKHVNVYSILDASKIFGEADTAQSLQANFLSLYLGHTEDLLTTVAPYLFAYQPESEFGKWLFEKGWGNAWGVFVEADVRIEDLRTHFRKFLLIKTEDDKELYFRFYDPRVLRMFLPTCNAYQLKEFFGPIKKFTMENDNASMALEFTLSDNNLISTEISKETFANNLIALENQTTFIADKKIINQVEKNDYPATSEKPDRKWNFLIE